jgi:hypothetical protein
MGHGADVLTEIERRIVRGEMAAGARLDEDSWPSAGRSSGRARGPLSLERDGFGPEDGSSFAVAR